METVQDVRKTSVILRLFFFLNILNSLALIGAYLATHISPNKLYYFAFFGLSYPIWLSIELLFIVFWLFFKRKFIWLSLLTILLGINHLKDFYAINLSQTTLKSKVKFLSYNVHIFNLYDLENRIEKRDQIFNFLKTEDAGVYCFQEFYHQDGHSNFETKNKLIDLLKTPYYHERYTHEMTGKQYFGVATFSKYPIINKGEIPFENDPNNFCIYSDIVTDLDTIRVFNAHIGSIRFQPDDYRFFEDNDMEGLKENNEAGKRILRILKIGFEKRTPQALKIAEEIKKSPHPVVLCGDLNDTPVSYCYRQFNSLLNDAFVQAGNGIGTTYVGVVPSNRIDYIFYDERFESANFKTHAIKSSDHEPISCEIGN
ncbi:endonuclease/exonuclease/phosphatase family protein [Crocinitomix algicola]|uniref:endonuclease/exonuclease/phosphatase family protein n=1 Tax=Crocinitomix algicola TaxID=1740263 RepID=UPI000871DE1A|nr:endonuclease/exonuclease/phosphatase family protein [Crocinitomix algicola]